MLEINVTSASGLVTSSAEDEQIEPGAWFNLIKPSPQELRLVSEHTGAPLDFLRAALDQEESSRIEVEDDHILIIVNVPKNEDGSSLDTDTEPLGIVVSRDHVITICLEGNEVLSGFDKLHHHFFDTRKRTRFLFQILYRSALIYLKDLRMMNRRTDDIERDLRRSMQNKELFMLLDLQKTLTYFTVSLRSNRTVIERLMRLFAVPSVSHLVKLREEDEELLEDVRIEYDQAIEMAQMHSSVLAGMMDAFASVISNNLNIVMKFLASVTIVLSIPTMIASFYGMNVNLPLQGNPYGFSIVMLITAGMTVWAIWWLWKKKMF